MSVVERLNHKMRTHPSSKVREAFREEQKRLKAITPEQRSKMKPILFGEETQKILEDAAWQFKHTNVY